MPLARHFGLCSPAFEFKTVELTNMPKPTILHVSSSAKLYGAEQSTLILIEGLSRKGYRSVVAVPRAGPLTKRLEALGVPVVYLPLMKRWLTKAQVPGLKRFLYNPYQFPFLLRSAVALRMAIRQHQVDLVHTANSVVFDGALAAALARIPHVWHLREPIEPGREWRFFLGTTLARTLISHFADRIISTSEAIANSYLHTPCGTDKVRVIYNGVDLKLYDDDIASSTVRRRLAVPTSVKLVGMMAQMAPRKRHEDFLRAAVIVQQAVPDSFFLSVGGNLDTPYGQAMKALSHELGLAERINWLGFCHQANEIFKALDVLVLPSVEESTPRVIMEAMAARKPVVATAVDGVPELVVDGATGLLIPPRSPADLAEAIIQILSDSQLAEKMGRAGRQRAESCFSLDQYVDHVEEIYLELLQG